MKEYKEHVAVFANKCSTRQLGFGKIILKLCLRRFRKEKETMLAVLFKTSVWIAMGKRRIGING